VQFVIKSAKRKRPVLLGTGLAYRKLFAQSAPAMWFWLKNELCNVLALIQAKSSLFFVGQQMNLLSVV
jgi:hypothetical protein